MSGSQSSPQSAWTHGIAGFIAGAVTTGALHPLDLIKTRLQAHDGRAGLGASYRNTWHAFITIARTDGPKALYQGVTPNVVGASVSWGLYLLVYEWMKDQLRPLGELAGRPTAHLLAATGAGVVTAFCTNPIWVVKTRMCLPLPDGRPPPYSGMFDALRTIARREGVAGLYAGLVPALFNVSHGAVQFVVYERLKTGWRARNPPAAATGADRPLGPGEALLLGAAAKLAASTTTYPLQVVKTRLQMHPELKGGRYRTVVNTLTHLVRDEGFRGFYKGFGANLLRVTPAAALTFAVYESVLRLFAFSFLHLSSEPPRRS